VERVNAHNNFFYFTLALVILLLTSALVGTSADGEDHLWLHGIMLVTELAAYFSLNLSKHWRRFVIAMIVLMLIGNSVREFTNWSMAPVVALVGSLIFYCGMAYAAAKQVLFSGRIEGNTIIGAIAIYLLMGLIWGVLYLLTLEFWHDAFNGISYRSWSDNFSTSLYFSFVTMTSLGYGDISPAVPVSRVLAYLQAISGAFYMAIVVASMVGARVSKNLK
jgi:voltage-gated potassium channel